MAMSSSDSEEEIIVDDSDNIIPYNFEPVLSYDDDDESVSSDSSHEEDYRISNTRVSHQSSDAPNFRRLFYMEKNILLP